MKMENNTATHTEVLQGNFRVVNDYVEKPEKSQTNFISQGTKGEE